MTATCNSQLLSPFPLAPYEIRPVRQLPLAKTKKVPTACGALEHYSAAGGQKTGTREPPKKVLKSTKRKKIGCLQVARYLAALTRSSPPVSWADRATVGTPGSTGGRLA